MNYILTVFTPTYNRAYCLHNCYQSLCRQTSKNFCWLIVDDGSTDNTRLLVASWIDENRIPIRYIYQENQGMHGAHNTAYNNISTEFNVCIDSDDYMPDNAVEIILKNLENLGERFAGLVGLDADTSGVVIGTRIPEGLIECTLTELYQKYKVKGDKKMVYRTDVVKKFPEYPLFKGEKLVPLSYLYSLIDQDYKLKPLNEVLVVVDYQTEGSSKTIFRQYMKYPRGFAFFRISTINLSESRIEKFKNAIHLVSSAIFARDLDLLRQCGKPILILFAFPYGVILSIYIRMKVSNQNK
jgi:hypothetical protein